MNPYRDLPDFAFWRRAVGALAPEDVDPVVAAPFLINRTDRVATAGSCFAQHISRTLGARGFRYLVTEPGPLSADAADEGYGVFPARFANIYTVRQLLQLFERAHGLYDPEDRPWRRPDGSWLDPFRPRIQVAGFASAEAVERDRDAHLGAVRAMFEQCDVFVFTLGLTEAWVSARTGAIVPLAPGVVSGDADDADYGFCNFDVAEMTADMLAFIDNVRRINPDMRLVLTVSPVPLIATYERRHVLVSTTLSKAALCVVADAVSRARPNVAYFPAYEIIAGPQSGGRFYEPDLREIRPEGVSHVMRIFSRHFLADVAADAPRSKRAEQPSLNGADLLRQRMAHLEAIVCDEEALDAPRREKALN